MDPLSPREQFADLLGRHQVQLMGYIYALVHNMNDAEEVYQQTSIILWRKFEEFETGSDFFRWASTIARYEVLNFFRTSSTRRRYFSERFVADMAADRTPEVAQYMEERRQALAGCLEKLKPNDRRLVERCYAGGQRVKDVAASLGRSAKSVSDSLSRIRRALYDCINRAVKRGGDA